MGPRDDLVRYRVFVISITGSGPRSLRGMVSGYSYKSLTLMRGWCAVQDDRFWEDVYIIPFQNTDEYRLNTPGK
jgi:hypothetical protein